MVGSKQSKAKQRKQNSACMYLACCRLTICFRTWKQRKHILLIRNCWTQNPLIIVQKTLRRTTHTHTWLVTNNCYTIHIRKFHLIWSFRKLLLFLKRPSIIITTIYLNTAYIFLNLYVILCVCFFPHSPNYA